MTLNRHYRSFPRPVQVILSGYCPGNPFSDIRPGVWQYKDPLAAVQDRLEMYDRQRFMKRQGRQTPRSDMAETWCIGAESGGFKQGYSHGPLFTIAGALV